EEGPETEEQIERLSSDAESVNIDLVGSAVVAPGQFVFYPILDEIEKTAADAVLLLIGADAQEQPLSQAASPENTTSFFGISGLREQTPPHLQRYLQVAPELATQPRVVAWDPAAALQVN